MKYPDILPVFPCRTGFAHGEPLKVIYILMSSLFFLSFSGAEELRSESPILGYDKALHFAAGYVISDTIFALQRYNNALLPFLVPAAAGAGKELYDNYFDWKDFGCTCLGAVTRICIPLTGTEELRLGSLTVEYKKVIAFAGGYITAELVFMFQRSDDVFLPILLPAAAGAGIELLEGDFDWKSAGYAALGAVVRSVLRLGFKF